MDSDSSGLTDYGVLIFRCRFCGARIAVPYDVLTATRELKAGRKAPPPDRDTTVATIRRHMAFNPELHPGYADTQEQ